MALQDKLYEKLHTVNCENMHCTITVYQYFRGLNKSYFGRDKVEFEEKNLLERNKHYS